MASDQSRKLRQLLWFHRDLGKDSTGEADASIRGHDLSGIPVQNTTTQLPGKYNWVVCPDRSIIRLLFPLMLGMLSAILPLFFSRFFFIAGHFHWGRGFSCRSFC